MKKRKFYSLIQLKFIKILHVLIFDPEISLCTYFLRGQESHL
jgi:hypothetical protein